MNLSAMNTGLTQALATPLSEAQAPGHAAARLPSGTLSGQDFAAFLRQQVQGLKTMQRQEVAAAKTPPPPQGKPDVSSHKADKARADKSSQDNNEAQQDRVDHDKPVEAASASQGVPEALEQTAADLDKPADTGVSADLSTSNVVATPEEPAPHPTVQATLTTIPLSPTINIITATPTLPDDQSVADFALAMGLAPDQVQALFGSTSPIAAATHSAMPTQQILGMNTLATVSAPAWLSEPLAEQASVALPPGTSTVAVSSADFQALHTETSLDNESPVQTRQTAEALNLQIITGQASAAVSAPPVSTLAVLSMLDTQLRPEDVEALQQTFDNLTALDSDASTEHGLGLRLTESSSASQQASKAAQALAAQPNMAETYDKLSQKLATELAGRMHQQLNAGEWKMKFALKPASLGLVDVQLEMRDGQLTAQFNADTSLTQDLIQHGSQRLKEALSQLGMNNASVLVGQGQNQQQGSASNQRQPSDDKDNRVTLSDGKADEQAVRARPRHSNSLQFDNYA